jgi:hypothetical protein
MRVSQTSPSQQRSPDRLNFDKKPPTDLSAVLRAVDEKSGQNGDARTIAGTLNSIYLQFLERIFALLEERGKANSREAIRAARFALKDECDLLGLVDRVVRGCLGTRTGISFEAMMRINDKPEPPSDELRRLRFHCLMIETMYEKSRLYGLPLPPLKEFRERMEDQWSEEVRNEQERNERGELAIDEFLKRLSEDANLTLKKGDHKKQSR